MAPGVSTSGRASEARLGSRAPLPNAEGLGADQRPSGGSSSCDEVDDQRDEGEQKQEVYEPTCDVKYDEAENPGDQKQNKQRDKDEAHISPLAPRTVAFVARGTPRNLMTWPR